MRYFIVAAALVVCATAAGEAQAQPGKTYPKVYGATGSLYGPTQAHYQFARRYGREWTGGGSGHAHHGHHGHGHHYNIPVGCGFYGGSLFGSYGYGSFGYGYGYGAVGYPVISPFYGYSYAAAYPIVIQSHPLIIGPDPFDNDVLKQQEEINDLQKIKDLLALPGRKVKPIVVKKSNGAARQRSLHQQGLGDLSFQQQDYAKAYAQYRSAAKAAPDLPDNYFRMGWALAAAGHYESAVREIKRGLRLDPYWPLTGASLDERFGFDHKIAKNAVLLAAAQWVREDIRDPDRLFLMGVLLHFNDDVDRALKFFETAGQLAGSPQHVQLFLHPQEPPDHAAAGDAADDGAADDVPAADDQPADGQPPGDQPGAGQQPAAPPQPPAPPQPQPEANTKPDLKPPANAAAAAGNSGPALVPPQ